MANCVSTRHCNEQHNEEYLIVFWHTWNYRDNRDNKQHYRDIGEFLLSLSPTTNVSKLRVDMEGFCQLLE